MQIHGLHQANAPQSIDRVQSTATTSVSEAGHNEATSAADQLDLSPEAQALSQSQSVDGSASGEIRMEKVAAIRQAIADGVYETPEKMSQALDRLLDTFA